MVLPNARFLSLAVLTILVASGCKKKAAPAGAAAAGGFATQVVAVEAKRQPVVELLSLVGTVTPNEMVELKAEIDGVVQEINFDEGQRVEKGRLLVRLDESKLGAMLAETEANLKLSTSNHERAKQLLKDKLVSEQEFDQTASSFAVNQATVELTRRQLRDARILAPFSGMVGARQISPGQVISRNTTLTWLVDLDTVKVEVNVPEKYLSQMKNGQQLDFYVAAFPKESFRGEVYFISPQLDAGTRTALIKARVPNPSAKLKGGMFANLNLNIQLRDSAIVIPEPALVNNGDAVMVFGIDAQSKAVIKPVTVGLRLAGKVEILTGLEAGDKVVVEGVQKLFPGALVKLSGPEAAAAYETGGK